MPESQENSNRNIIEKEPTKNHRDWISVSQRLKDWVSSKKNVMIMEEFLALEDIPYQTFASARKRVPELNDAYEYARLVCGINREKLALKNNATTAKDSLPQFLDRCRDHEEWKAKLKADIDNGANVPKAVIDYILSGKVS